MPTYEYEVEGKKYQVESDKELDETEMQSAAYQFAIPKPKTAKERYLVAPLTDPLGDPGKVPTKKVPQTKPKAQPQNSALTFRQKYVKPTGDENAMNQYREQFLSEGSKSTPAMARDYLRTLPLKDREAALEAHPQYRLMSAFGKKAVLRSSYVLDNDAQTIEREAAKRANEQQLQLGKERQRHINDELTPQNYAADKKRAEAVGKLNETNAAREGSLLNRLQPGFDAELAKGKGVRGGLQKLAAGAVETLPETIALGGIGKSVEIGNALAKVFGVQGAVGAVQSAADIEMLKNDPAQYFTLLAGNAAMAAAPVAKPAVRGIKRGIGRATEGIVPDVNMSGVGEGVLPVPNDTVLLLPKPKDTKTAKSSVSPKVETPKAAQPQAIEDIAMDHPDPIQRLLHGMETGEVGFQVHPTKGQRAINQRTGEVFDNANGLLREGQTANKQNYTKALKEKVSKQVMAADNDYTRADVERLRDQGYVTDEAFNSYVDRWNSSPRVGIPMTRVENEAFGSDGALIEPPQPLATPPQVEAAPLSNLIPETPKPATVAEMKPPAPKVTQGAPAVSDMSRMRMRDVESFAATNDIPLQDMANARETNQQVAERAAKEYDDILHSIKDYDPQKNALATAEERFVAGARLNAIARELNTAKGDDAKRLVNEATQLAQLSRRAASQLGRDLQFQKVVLGDKTDPASVVSRAFMVTDGNLSEPARKSLYALAEKAQDVKKRIDGEVSQRASTGQDMRPKRTPVSKQERDAAVSALRGKMARTNALADFGISLADALPDLVTVGKFALQEKKRSFSEWAAEMKAAVPEADDTDIREVWAAMGKGVQPKSLQERATRTLSELGNPPTPRPNTTPESLAIDKAYADGATDLNRFARAVRAKLGDKVTDAQLQTMFRDAAVRYRENYKELDDIKAEMAAVVQKELYRAKNPLQKAGVWAGEATKVPSTLLATLDFSGLLRQGGIATVTQTRKAGVPATRAMFQAAKSEAAAKGILDSIKTGRANSKIYEEAKLDIVDPESPNLLEREEQFLSNLVGKAPFGIGKAHEASERAYATVGNVLRTEWFDTLYDPSMKPEEARDLARFINIATGRADLSPKYAQGLPAAASVLWSPRFMLSRIQYLAGVPLAKASSATTRKLIAKEYAKYYSKVLGGVALASALGAEVETDRRSKDFLKVKFGRVELDPFSGLRQYPIEATRALMGQKMNAQRELEPNRISEQAGQFVQGKLTPFNKMAVSLLTPPVDGEGNRTPKDFTGKPYTAGKVAREMLVPISINNLIEGFTEFGYTPDVARDLAVQFSADFFGMSTNVRDRDKEQREKARETQKSRDRAAGRQGIPKRKPGAPFSIGKLLNQNDGA